MKNICRYDISYNLLQYDQGDVTTLCYDTLSEKYQRTISKVRYKILGWGF